MSKSLDQARQQHEKWLLKNGCHPKQLKQRKKISTKPKAFGVSKEYYGELSNTIAPPRLDNSIWEKIRLGNESSKTISDIRDKATRVAPAYNKGGLQVLSGNEMKNAGRKL